MASFISRYNKIYRIYSSISLVKKIRKVYNDGNIENLFLFCIPLGYTTHIHEPYDICVCKFRQCLFYGVAYITISFVLTIK